MYDYAQLNNDNIVVAVSRLSGLIEASNMILINTTDENLIGKKWTGSKFTDVDAAKYPVSLVINTIAADQNMDHNDELTEVTCKVGTRVTVSAAIQTAGGQVVPITDKFRMPIRSRDGKEDLWLVNVTNGQAEMILTMDTSGIWQVIEDSINEALPVEKQMGFAGITIYVCR